MSTPMKEVFPETDLKISPFYCSADSFSIGVCPDPECHRIHILLCDADDIYYSGFSINPEDLDGFINGVRTASALAEKKGQSDQ